MTIRHLRAIPDHVITLTGIIDFRDGFITRSYFTAITPLGESVSIHFEGRISTILHCLTRKRICRQPVSLKLLNCSSTPRSRTGRRQINPQDRNRQVFFTDVEFADSRKQQVYEQVRADKSVTVGARFDAILAGDYEQMTTVAA